MTTLRSAPPRRLSRLVGLVVHGVVVVATIASGAACSSSSNADSSPDGQSADAPFQGLWSAHQEGVSFDVNVDSDRATIVRFGPGFEIGNPEVINGGDLFLKGMTRVDSKTFRGQVASIVFANSPTFPKKWPESMQYVDVTIQWDEATSKWTSSSPKVELGKQSRSFDGKYDPAGACEKKFANNNNVTLYICEYPQAADGCSSSGEKAFWPSTDCKHLGYAAVSKDALASGAWQHSATDNVMPGEHGKWGDGTGGGKIVSTAAAAAGSTGGGDGGGGGGGGTPIASCADAAQHVCSEILTGDAAAYAAQCTKNGQVGSLGPCDAAYKNGATCMNAKFKSVGVPVTGNFWWKSDYCALTNDMIDTHGTCCDLGGTPSKSSNCRGLNSGTCP